MIFIKVLFGKLSKPFSPGSANEKQRTRSICDAVRSVFLKGLCEQCPAKSWMEHGTLDTPVEYLCDVAHAQARYLGLIGDSEKAWEVTNGKERVERFASGS